MGLLGDLKKRVGVPIRGSTRREGVFKERHNYPPRLYV